MFSHILVGMELRTSLWTSRNLLLWLSVYTGSLLLTGRVAEQELFKKKYYTLIRYGDYRKWWKYLFARIVRVTFFYVLAVWAICNTGLLVWREETVLSYKVRILSLFVLMLSWTMIAVLQMVIMFWAENSKIPFIIIVVVTIAALWGAERVEGFGGKLIFINWGMIIRSSLYQKQGFDIALALASETGILAIMYQCTVPLKQRFAGGKI